MKKEARIRLLISLGVLIVTTICFVITQVFDLKTTAVKVIGSYASIPIVTLVLWKFPLRFYAFGLGFDIFATSLGSVLNLYHYIGYFDRFVHFLSGILLAEGGMLIIRWLYKKRNAPTDEFLQLAFAFTFSCSCAAFWEIYEFSADTFIKTSMQGVNSNTMGDIVSGVLGGLVYSAIYLIVLKRKRINKQ